ncbi:unnamed protein product [Dovyalis caffra]|uniref:WRKY domain-containing protein n=1 Tax=Dovyalis caffra TaxID=77055 RepID=A0AAV1S3F3_9ROSI|nr:unnamed protein product [Dovyalis caffra]
MAVDLVGYSKMEDQMAMQEAASAGLKSMEHLIFALSNQPQQSHQLDCREITNFTVAKFKQVISILNRTGHARFRRGPTSSPSFNPVPIRPVVQEPQQLNLDFVKSNNLTKAESKTELSLGSHYSKDCFSSGTTTSSFLSSVTVDGSVSNGNQGGSSSLFGTQARSTGKPPLSSTHRKKCHDHALSAGKISSSSGRCHCSKRRKSRLKRTVRVPAISSKIADIPPDEYSWRKYGQKPIKGSPYPRGYYKCSSVRGCPARKHVERAVDDPAMLIVTYEGEHRHSHTPLPDTVTASAAMRHVLKFEIGFLDGKSWQMKSKDVGGVRIICKCHLGSKRSKEITGIGAIGGHDSHVKLVLVRVGLITLENPKICISNHDENAELSTSEVEHRIEAIYFTSTYRSLAISKSLHKTEAIMHTNVSYRPGSGEVIPIDD